MPFCSTPGHSRTRLRNLLYRQAARYSLSEDVRNRLVDRIALALLDDPSPDDERDLFRAMHRLAVNAINDGGYDGGADDSAARPIDTFAPSDPSARPLTGRQYLVVEDEYLIASDMLTTLEDAGASVLGPLSRVDQALEVLAGQSFALDAAILDVNLQGELVYPAAALLARQGTPFLFVTGYDLRDTPEEFRQIPCLSKPCPDRALIRALVAIADRSSTPRTR